MCGLLEKKKCLAQIASVVDLQCEGGAREFLDVSDPSKDLLVRVWPSIHIRLPA